jgi:hypothetical protein
VEIELQGIAQTLFFMYVYLLLLHRCFVLFCDCKDRNKYLKMQIGEIFYKKNSSVKVKNCIFAFK